MAAASEPPVSQRAATRWRPEIVGAVVGAAVAVWSTAGAWGGRPPAGEDVTAHLVRLDFGISHLVAHGRLDGWFPNFYLGYQEFLFNGPGLNWCVALVRALTFGGLSNAGALKVIGIASFAALPAAVAFLARSLGLGHRAAGLAAVLSLLVSNVFGFGLQGLYVVGLIPHQVGAVFFCVALGALLQMLDDDRPRWVVLAAVALVALAVTHLISVMILAVLYPLCVIGRASRGRMRWRSARRLAITAALAIGLAAWWLVPLLAHRDLRGIVATWATPPLGARLSDIVYGRILFRPYTALLIFAGGAYGLSRVARRRPYAGVLLVAPIAYLVIAHNAYSQWPTNEITLQLSNRGLGYLGLLAILPLAAAFGGVVWWLGRQGLRRGFDRASTYAYALALAVAVVVVVSPLGPSRTVARQLADPVPAMHGAARELARVVPDGARFAMQVDYPTEITRLGVIAPAHWLAHESGRNSLNGFNIESSNTPGPDLVPLGLSTTPAAATPDQLARYGVTHVVTSTSGLAATLSASNRFSVVWHAAPLTILAVVAPSGQPSPASLVSAPGAMRARLVRVAPASLAFALDTTRARQVTLAVAWSPKWHARLDGRALTLGHDHDRLITAAVPAGHHTLTLRYRDDRWDALGCVLSVATLLGLVVWLVLRRRGGRPRRAPDGATGGDQSTSKSSSRIA
jgi:hypothetical protein